MLGFNDREALRRWIAEAGLICIGAGLLWTSGCAGTARDGLAHRGASPSKEASVAAADKAGHASLSDRAPSARPRAQRPSAQVAARKSHGNAKRPTSGDPFLSSGREIARRQSRPTRPPQAPIAPAVPPAAEAASSSSVAQVASREPANPPKATAAANVRPAAAQSAVARSASPRKRESSTIAQASAKMPADARRVKPSAVTASAATVPVITPAGSGGDPAASTATDFERQRADRLMDRAHFMLSQNFREEALRLASVAEQLETSKQAVYRPGEDRPSELVRLLQRTAAIGADAPIAADDPVPEGIIRRSQRNRSRPTAPITLGDRRGSVEFTDIRAGWQRSADGDATTAAAVDPVASGNSTAVAGDTQVARAESIAAAASAVEAPAPAIATPAATESAAATSAAATIDEPQAEIADLEPIIENNAAPAASPINGTMLAGLAAGLAGVLGLGYWRRQERKHYQSVEKGA